MQEVSQFYSEHTLYVGVISYFWYASFCKNWHSRFPVRNHAVWASPSHTASKNRVSLLTRAVEICSPASAAYLPMELHSTVASFRSDGGFSAASVRPHAHSAGYAGLLHPIPSNIPAWLDAVADWADTLPFSCLTTG